MAAEASGVLSRWLDRGASTVATARTDRTAVRPRIPEPVRRRMGRAGAGPVEESRWVSGFDAALALADDVGEPASSAASPRLAWAADFSGLVFLVLRAALMARMVSSSASGTPALRAAMILRTSGTSMVSAPRKSVIRCEKRISWGVSGAEGACSASADGSACGVWTAGWSACAPGTSKEAVWWDVVATTGLAEAVEAGAAAEARCRRRPADREAGSEAAPISGSAEAVCAAACR